MVLTGGPCVGQQKRRRREGDDEPDQPCGAVESPKWYHGPMCKNCYRRKLRAHGTQLKMAKTEDVRTESGGDIPLICLKVSAARCALPPIAPALSPPACPCCWRERRVPCLHRSQIIPWTLVDLSMTRATDASSTTSTAGSSSSPTPRCATPRSSAGAAARPGAGRRLGGGGSEAGVHGGEAEDGQDCYG